MHEIAGARVPFEPRIQRYRDYARQRQMTLSDLLLENRIVFPDTETIKGTKNAPPNGEEKITATILTVPYQPNTAYEITIIVDENGEYAGGANKGKNTLKGKYIF